MDFPVNTPKPPYVAVIFSARLSDVAKVERAYDFKR